MHASHALSSLKIGGSVLVPSVLESTGFQNTLPSSQLEEEEDWGWGVPGQWAVSEQSAHRAAGRKRRGPGTLSATLSGCWNLPI